MLKSLNASSTLSQVFGTSKLKPGFKCWILAMG